MSAPRGHEPLDPPMRPVVVGLLITTLACAAGGLITLGIVHEGRDHVRLMPADPGWYRRYPAEVAEIEAAPFSLPTDAERGADAAQRRLRSYGWVSRERRVVHVPLEVAIEAYLAGRDAGAP